MRKSVFAGIVLAWCAPAIILSDQVKADGPPAEAPERRSRWWEGPLCISDVQFAPDEIRKLGPEGVAQRLADLGFNLHEQAFPALPGYEGSFLRAPGKREEYPALIRACQARGIRVVAYLNVHGFYSAQAQGHEDWVQRLPDGKPALEGGGRWVRPCYNGPWRDFASDEIGRLAKEYAIDGVFLDGPGWAEQTCYCAVCRRVFRQSSGLEIPAWGDWSNPAWPAFLKFRAGSLARFVADVRKRLDEAQPDQHLILFMNNQALRPSWRSGQDARALAPYLDILGNERALLFHGAPMLSPPWLCGTSVKIMESLATPGQPVVQYCCFRHLPWDYYALPAEEFHAYIAGALAQGGHAQVMGGARYLDPPLQEVVRRLNRLQQTHPDVFCRTRSAANVALFWPQQTMDFGGRRQPTPGMDPKAFWGPAWEEFAGWAEVLFRGFIPYDVFDEAILEAGPAAIARYRVVILPGAQCLSAKACAAIREHVRQGGHLVASATASLCNEYDTPRSDFALADLFGASYAGRLIGPLPIDYLELKPDSAPPPRSEARLLSGIDRRVIPAPRWAVAVRPQGSAVLAVHLDKLLTQYEPLKPASEPPVAVLANRFGKGTCVFLTGTFGAGYWQHRFPEFRRLMTNAVLWQCTPPVRLAKPPSPGVAIPETVEVAWRLAAKGQWLLHLVNHTGSMSRPIERLLPVRDLCVAIPALVDARHIKARALVSDTPIAVERRDGVPHITIPSLNVYEVVVLSITEPDVGAAEPK